MKRGILFILPFLIILVFITGIQSCQPTLIIGDSQANTCCELRSGSITLNYINDITSNHCDNLAYNIYGNYFGSNIFTTKLPNSCEDVYVSGDLSCIYKNNIYENGEFLCHEIQNLIYQCINGKWVEYLDCENIGSICVNSESCSNPEITNSMCSTGDCIMPCTPDCQFIDDCDNGPVPDGCGGICERNTNGNSCNSGEGICNNEVCEVVVTQVSTGSQHTCAVLSDGTIKCCGWNINFRLGSSLAGFGANPTPINVMEITNAIQVSAGGSHTCAVLSTGNIKCWGSNNNGQLGDGTTTNSMPVNVMEITNAIQVSAGGSQTCAVLSTGNIKCWGLNTNGQLGDNKICGSYCITPVDVIGITDAIQVSTTGGSHTCAVLSTGNIKCWGRNYEGELGDGTTTDSAIPVDVVGITDAIQVSTGHKDSCAILSTGNIKCWGLNTNGQLGDGTTTDSAIPVDVVGITNAINVASLESTTATCAVLSTGNIKCWGDNTYGTLGDGTGTNSLAPVDVVGITDAIQVSTTGDHHICALLSTNEEMCWGRNSNGELGTGSTTGPDPIKCMIYSCSRTPSLSLI